ncbi:uridine kinase [Desulfitobacterium dehalogenans ATCC 51507]|uniref:Uridine kinase n=1 Tax=Desulfitobacterium dehalogenans (strain ATCC 51507 / DSM 9161 / JW/IU-DC1) TaxID=756499 RepID=I4AA68_DESDJ|nr:nucleoside kinase [Desulfitobacterium dehalogenans]AFM00853.1 uridine kinase [Desulfitobacterium dehalogenans ATCC 51507]
MSITETTHRQYRQTLIFGLIRIVEELFPQEEIKIQYSILDGIYCELENSPLSPREVAQIEEKLHHWVDSKPEIMSCEEEDGFFHTKVNHTFVKSLYPAMRPTGTHYPFMLIFYHPGFILLFSNPEHPCELPNFVPPEKLTATFLESQRWVENLHLDKVESINRNIQKGKTTELISLAEALHEKKISLIADRILEQRKNTRIILISGPSSSGKTTFAQRLSTQLRVNGIRPIALSLDNYFFDREHTPLDENGQYDFEALEALDLPLLNQHVNALIHGQEIECPVFDFVEGRRKPEGTRMKLEPDEILVMEGIHALNPRLLPSLERSHLFKIYISALFQPNIDTHNRISTTDVRLIRRLVRDNKYRGINPEKTLNQWSSVRRGENNNIFPYQEEADIMFNSSLLYELNALKAYAEPLLINIPKDHPYYSTASHLLRLLYHFETLDIAKVPFNSILREFIGGGIY